MILKKKELADELALRTGFFKGSMEDVVEALDKIIVEKLGQATFDEDVKIKLAKGVTIGAYRVAAREARDPRNQEVINVPEKIVPYADFTYTFRQKINK